MNNTYGVALVFCGFAAFFAFMWLCSHIDPRERLGLLALAAACLLMATLGFLGETIAIAVRA